MLNPGVTHFTFGHCHVIKDSWPWSRRRFQRVDTDRLLPRDHRENAHTSEQTYSPYKIGEDVYY